MVVLKIGRRKGWCRLRPEVRSSMSAFLVLSVCWVLGRVAVGDVVRAQCGWIGGWQGVAGGACRRWGRVTDQGSGEGVDRFVEKRGKSRISLLCWALGPWRQEGDQYHYRFEALKAV